MSASYTLNKVMLAMGFVRTWRGRKRGNYYVSSIGHRRPLKKNDKSHHRRGNALDVAGPRQSYVATVYMDNIFDAWAPYAPYLLELIYAWRKKNVKRGRWVPRYAVSLHRNHVHIAATPANAQRILKMVRAGGIRRRRRSSNPQPAVPGGYPGFTFREGSRHRIVGRIQRRLREIGYRLEDDNDFGPITDRAVRRFQRIRHLKRDGIVGRRTWRALFGR